MKEIWRLAIQEWRRMALASFWAFLTVASSVGLMMSSGYILTYASLQPSIAVLSVAIVGVRFFGIARGVFRWLERVVSHETALHLLEHYRVWFYNRIEPMVPVGIRHIARGDMFQALARDIDSLEFLYVRVIAPPLVALWTAFLMLFLLGSQGIVFWLIFIFAQICAITFSLSLMPKMTKASQSARQNAAQLQSTLIDILKAQHELAVAQKSALWHNEVMRIEALMNKATMRSNGLTALGESINPAIGMLSVLAIVGYGGQLVASQELGGIIWVTLIFGAWAAFESVLAFPALAQSLQHSTAAGTRLFEISNATNFSVLPGNKCVDVKDEKTLIACSNLGFQWPDGGVIFRDFNFTVQRGECWALLGQSGAGKSTLIQLLLQYLVPTSGVLHIAKELTPEKIAVLDQNPQLFTGTLATNLLLANPHATVEEMQNALEKVALLDWAKSENAQEPTQAWIGEQGEVLSGGQRQRLASAQILLRNANLIILDEPAAHLDPQSEEFLLNLFMAQIAEKPQSALIVITHRKQFLQKFKQIKQFD